MSALEDIFIDETELRNFIDGLEIDLDSLVSPISSTTGRALLQFKRNNSIWLI